MNAERLNHLITVLEGIHTAHKVFDLSSWIQPIDTKGHKDSQSGEVTDEACGTVCCAMGYAALDPTFQAEGLTLRSDSFEGAFRTVQEFNAAFQDRSGYVFVSPEYEGNSGYDAAMAFFNITWKAAGYLFDPSEYSQTAVLPTDVISRVREVISLGGESPYEHDSDEDEYEDEYEDPFDDEDGDYDDEGEEF